MDIIDSLLTNPVFKEAYEKGKVQKTQFLDAVAYVKRNIAYPFKHISAYFEDCFYTKHIGYVQVEEHPLLDKMYYRVVGGEKCYPLLERQDDENAFHCLVWQKTEFEDCYSGYLLFPLKDGRYWMVDFEC